VSIDCVVVADEENSLPITVEACADVARKVTDIRVAASNRP
jgi:hypothetical protein